MVVLENIAMTWIVLLIQMSQLVMMKNKKGREPSLPFIFSNVFLEYLIHLHYNIPKQISSILRILINLIILTYMGLYMLSFVGYSIDEFLFRSSSSYAHYAQSFSEISMGKSSIVLSQKGIVAYYQFPISVNVYFLESHNISSQSTAIPI